MLIKKCEGKVNNFLKDYFNDFHIWFDALILSLTLFFIHELYCIKVCTKTLTYFSAVHHGHGVGGTAAEAGKQGVGDDHGDERRLNGEISERHESTENDAAEPTSPRRADATLQQAANADGHSLTSGEDCRQPDAVGEGQLVVDVSTDVRRDVGVHVADGVEGAQRQVDEEAARHRRQTSQHVFRKHFFYVLLTNLKSINLIDLKSI